MLTNAELAAIEARADVVPWRNALKADIPALLSHIRELEAARARIAELEAAQRTMPLAVRDVLDAWNHLGEPGSTGDMNDAMTALRAYYADASEGKP